MKICRGIQELFFDAFFGIGSSDLSWDHHPNNSHVSGLCCHPWLHRPATARSKYWPVRRWCQWGRLYEGFRELGVTSIAPYCTLHIAKWQAFFWTLSPTIPLPPTRTQKKTPHGPTSSPCPRRCRLMPFPMPWEHHWTSAAWDVAGFSGSLTHFIFWSKSDIHLRSFGDSSWFIITLPIHMEQPSVSLDNGWCVVPTQKKAKVREV